MSVWKFEGNTSHFKGVETPFKACDSLTATSELANLGRPYDRTEASRMSRDCAPQLVPPKLDLYWQQITRLTANNQLKLRTTTSWNEKKSQVYTRPRNSPDDGQPPPPPGSLFCISVLAHQALVGPESSASLRSPSDRGWQGSQPLLRLSRSRAPKNPLFRLKRWQRP